VPRLPFFQRAVANRDEAERTACHAGGLYDDATVFVVGLGVVEADWLLVWKIDRFGRSLKHLVNAPGTVGGTPPQSKSRNKIYRSRGQQVVSL
jgi:hypothetical protein